MERRRRSSEPRGKRGVPNFAIDRAMRVVVGALLLGGAALLIWWLRRPPSDEAFRPHIEKYLHTPRTGGALTGEDLKGKGKMLLIDASAWTTCTGSCPRRFVRRRRRR